MRLAPLALRSTLLILSLAGIAHACSSCAVPDQGDGATARSAYYGTAVFLTLLPGLLVLALVWWVRRQGLAGGGQARTEAGAPLLHTSPPGGEGGR